MAVAVAHFVLTTVRSARIPQIPMLVRLAGTRRCCWSGHSLKPLRATTARRGGSSSVEVRCAATYAARACTVPSMSDTAWLHTSALSGTLEQERLCTCSGRVCPAPPPVAGVVPSAGALEPPHAPLLAAWADFEATVGDADAAVELRRRCQALQPSAAAGGQTQHPAAG